MGTGVQDVAAVVTDHAEIEALLAPWRSTLGGDYHAYRGHVYRVFNFCRVQCDAVPDLESRLAIAAVFHDLGIWTDSTMDYLGPSSARAVQHLISTGRPEWQREITRMIELHHRLRPCMAPDDARVEAFRRADLTDVTGGLITSGIARDFIARVRRELPGQGFHRRILQLGLRWFIRHPLRPLPMMRW